MAELIKMPKMGATMTEGKLIKWLVKEGDTVEEGDSIFEVETDKLSNEIESYEDGTILKILVSEGETVPCQTPLAIIGETDEDISDFLKNI
jgi:pyruvate/2-oxoglutarate dehydrogenase complex dihydrolipoamide acyltransferase (E2) component